uniref:Uncharacterized protein n=1 Tax=Anguilla anguilla TaxID=7936 RepID=A0A0E9U835_ANGAN
MQLVIINYFFFFILGREELRTEQQRYLMYLCGKGNHSRI